MHFKRISQSNWTVTIIGSLIAAFLSGLLLMFVAVPYAIQKEAEKAQKNQRLAYFSSLHALRIETSQNQVFLKALPDGKAEGYIVAPTTIYAAKAVLSDMKVFEFGSRGLGLLLTIFLSSAEDLRQRIEAANHPNITDVDLKKSKGFHLDLLYFLQEKLDTELSDSPLKRGEVQDVFDRVKEIRKKWYGEGSR